MFTRSIPRGCRRCMGSRIVWLLPVLAAPAAQGQERPDPGRAPVRLVLTLQEATTAGLPLSDALEQSRRRFRLAGGIADEGRRRERMQELASAIHEGVPGSADPEWYLWMELSQAAHLAAGQTESAMEIAGERFRRIAAQLGAGPTSAIVLNETHRAIALREYAFATALLDLLDTMSSTRGDVFRAVMTRGRLHFERDGVDAAVAYYRMITSKLATSDPELAREAHFRAAEAYYRGGRLSEALAVLAEMEGAYPGTPEAEAARHARKGWEKAPDEQ
ncbi:MAG: hypothetical protein HY763_15870 [Planctomycetes bacterium]|nr:hypothetical protein [Planctomycetota bacterium]